jgi:methyl-accepting chemotaxis protein
MKNLSLKTKLLLLVITSMLGLVVFGAVSFMTLRQVEVNGPMYDLISMDKDVVADYVPPAQSLLPAVLYCVKMEEAADPATRQHYLDLLRGAQKDFEEGHAVWMRRVPEGQLKQLMAGSGYRIEHEYFEIAQKEFVPAVLAGELKQAHEIRVSKMAPLYAQQSAAVDEIVKAASELVKNNETESAAVIQTRMFTMLGVGIAAGVIVCLLGWMIARGILGPLGKTLTLLQALAEGDLRQQIEVDSKDEIGDMGRALNRAIEGLAKTVESITENAQHVASASEELNATSQQISANSEETSAQANVVSQASQQVNQNLQSVSTGAEEMTATIQSIASNAHEAATVASSAVQTAQAANASVGKLGQSSAEIGEVIKVITSIAQQTNLLALNATIEAARAGEAGKGFAVVANEVKELAKQTAKATEDISRKITAIQSDTKGAVEAIGSITAVINQVNDISGTIATAVEEQSATTNEMTRNVADAAKGSGEITHNIGGVAEAARGTSNSAQESQKAANELAEMAVQLQGLVSQFKINGAQGKAGKTAASGLPRAMAAYAGK